MKDESNHDMMVYNILMYITFKDEISKGYALEQLKALAKMYHVEKIKGQKKDLMKALLEFLKNDAGYQKTIPALLSSIQ